MKLTIIALKNGWRNRKAIWKALKTISSDQEFLPQYAGWHHWTFQKHTLYKDGVVVPDDCSLSMWIINEGDTKPYKGGTRNE